MKSFVLSFFTLFCLGIITDANGQACLGHTQDSCRPNINKQSNSLLDTTCNARYGAINHLEKDLQKFAVSHIFKSFEYLLMSTHFANYDANREGFTKLFRGFSDSKWADAIELIKHITKRGGKMDFVEYTDTSPQTKNYELYEIESLAKSLDIEKSIMKEAYEIHEKASKKMDVQHDPEITHYVEEAFIEKEADNIRKITGHITELSQMLAESEDNALSLYLFDDYIKGL